MATREQLQELASLSTKAFRSEMDAVARLSMAVKRISYLTHMRAEETGKLSRQLANRDIPITDTALDKRATFLVSPQADEELTVAYNALMKTIEALPIAARSQALVALKHAWEMGTV